jgi:hypothetical protein
MVLLGCFVFRVSLENLLRAAAENTAFVIGVMEFGAGRADTAVYEQKEFCGNGSCVHYWSAQRQSGRGRPRLISKQGPAICRPLTMDATDIHQWRPSVTSLSGDV